MSKYRIIIIGLVVSIFCVLYVSINIVSAEVIFSEIMYNPEGTDSGREWVEVYNNGSESVDLSKYKLLENDIAHKISAKDDGDTLLSPNSYAIIADNIEKFGADFLVSGLVLDSVFSLRNDGEKIELIDPTGQSTDSFNYVPDWGANGTGNSLQLSDNSWIPASPTPNKINETTAVNEGSDTSSGESGSSGDFHTTGSGSTHSNQADLSDYKPKNKLEISIGRERHVSVNTPVGFVLRHSLEEDDDFNDRSMDIEWSFGDGEFGRGFEVSNVYYNKGEYNVVATALIDDREAVSRTKVYVTDSSLDIYLHNSGEHVDIMLKNTSSEEINVGRFIIRNHDKSFRIPVNTIISAKNSVILSHKNTEIETFTDLSLHYPNGELLDRLEVEEIYLKLLEITPIENIPNILDIINKNN